MSGSSEACGGGGIVSKRGEIGADSQRVLLSVHNLGGAGGPTTTDVVTQLTVPDTTDDYGALLPLPSEPTLDPNPILTANFDQLDAMTAPQLYTNDGSDDSSGCGCLAVGGADDNSAGTPAHVSTPVTIGPVTAVVLSGEADAVDAWLTDNGFKLSDKDRATLESYVGYYFVAIRRSSTASSNAPSSIGVHFTMQGDHREVPLRFASIGAAPTVAITLFLAVAEAAGPSPPFAALTLNDLDRNDLKSGDYARAVQNAVGRHDNHAFVLESRRARESLPLQNNALGAFIGAGTTITRLSTVLPAAALTEDALFHTPYVGEVPSSRVVRNDWPVGSREVGLGSLAALLLIRRDRRRQLKPC